MTERAEPSVLLDPHERLASACARAEDAPLRDRLLMRGLGSYRGYGELLRALAALTGAGAGLRHVGNSVEGEPLFCLEVAAEGTPPDAPISVVLAGLHPIEWIGIETGLALVQQLLRGVPSGRRVLVFPLTNPDGLRRVEHNLRVGKRQFVRHNARGVDLNRNFEARWGHRHPIGRLLPMFASGTHAASEPEVAAIVHALRGRRVDRALSLHSFGGVVLYPSSYSVRAPHDVAVHRRWARRIGDLADHWAYRPLQGAHFGLGVTMGGLELDYFHDRHGAISLLIECSRGGLGLRPSRLFEPFAWFNPPRPQDIAERIADAAYPFVAGHDLV